VNDSAALDIKEVTMRIHHLNCISSCPLGGRLMDGGPESLLQRAQLMNHCLLIESSQGLILVDTGYGLQDVRDPGARLSRFFLGLLSPDLREELTAYRQIEKLDLDPGDVRHIVLTHLDFDHAGGLDDFPQAKVHMLRSERESAFAQQTWLDRQRYRPRQWGTKHNWIVYEAGEGASWFGFSRVRPLEGIPEDIALIPLTGHTFGHCGVAVNDGERWLLNAGDAYFHHAETDSSNPHCTPGLALYQLMMEKDHRARVWNQRRLRELRGNRSAEIEIFCSHDPTEFARLAGRAEGLPVAWHTGQRDYRSSPSL
jgi:glyoxylase-like metal-dependent hydrolase (beta-lactamase superfamily II)